MASRTKKRKAQKLPFNVLVVGKSGTGKSTFVRSFVEKDLIPPRDYDQFNDLTDRTVDITTYTEELEGDDQKIALTLIDTPGFGDNVNNSKSYTKILEYVENQHKRFLAEESRVVRNPKFQDTRVHVVLYFIPPTGHQLHELDVVFMTRLAKRVNILPVIGKADTLTPSELKSFKKRIMDDINALGIPIFDFPVNSDDDEDIVQENKEFKALLPFSVIASDDIKDGKRVRQYPWGVSEVSNESHCDFEKLATVLLSSHLEELKEKTHNELYEAYREESLKRGVDKIEQELVEAERIEKEQKEKESADRARRIALKQEKLKRILSEDGDAQSASDEAKKKKAKPKKAEGEADDKDEEKKKKKKKKECKEGEED